MQFHWFILTCAALIFALVNTSSGKSLLFGNVKKCFILSGIIIFILELMISYLEKEVSVGFNGDVAGLYSLISVGFDRLEIV